jgi:AraC-like DNA-binding protein
MTNTTSVIKGSPISVSLAKNMPAQSMAELIQVGELFARSGMFGACNPSAGFIIALTCYQEGLSAMEFVRTYHLIDGRPTKRSDALLAEFRKRGGRYKIIENSVNRASIEATFEGQTHTFSYTMEDGRRTRDALQRNDSLKENWQKRPDDMMWARVVSKMCRRLCPEINSGVYTPEEVQDFEATAARAELSPDEILRRTKQTTGTSVTVYPAQDNPDYSLCPLDGVIDGQEIKGRPWTAFKDEELMDALDMDDDVLPEAYKAQIRIVIRGKETE